MKDAAMSKKLAKSKRRKTKTRNVKSGYSKMNTGGGGGGY